MSTTGIENWALDLKDVAQIYPFQGSEGILFIIGLVTWIGWHIWCAKWETNYHDEKIQPIQNRLFRGPNQNQFKLVPHSSPWVEFLAFLSANLE